MAIIYSYPLNTPKREDLLIGTVTYDENAQDPVVGNPTVSFTVGSLLDLVAAQGAAQNLQQVTNIGNTTTNSIVISNSLKVAGGYYDSSNQPGTSGQILSSTATGTQWVNVAAQGVTSVGLSMPAAFTVANSPITQSGTLTVTGAGTAAQYINGLGNLVTFPTIPAPYVLPVATTVALGGIKIGYTEAGKNYPLELDNEQAYVNVPWTDTVYSLPLAADGTRGGVQIGYAENAKNYPVELDNEKMFVNVPWTDTQTIQTITGTGSDNTDSGVLLSDSGGTVLILGSGSVAASQTGNTITLTGTDTGVTGVTLATADSTGSPLSESITNRELTLTSHKYVGGANVGYVPEGGTSDLYLKGDGTWAAIPTGLIFKGTWDASGGGGGSPDLTLAANKGAGFLWICDVAGTAYPNGGTNPPSTWALGDWAVYDGTAWTRVPATNSGVTSLTTTDGGFINLTPNAATTGAVTVTADLSAQDGTSDTSTRFLSKDNTWDVPSYTTDNDTTYTIDVPTATTSINLKGSDGTDDAIVLTGGTNVTLSRTDASTIDIAATDTNTTYTAGTGLTLTGTVFSADVDATQATSATNSLSTTTNRYYAVQLDNNSTVADAKLVVNIPWTDNESYNWTIKDNATNPASSVVDSGETIQFVTATGPLGTVLTEPTTGNFVMTLTSPDTTYSNFTGASANAAGTSGLVIAPPAGAQGKFLRGDATWVNETTYSTFTGADGTNAGTSGLVPAPAAADNVKFLKGDGTWASPPNDQGVETFTNTNGTYISATENSTATGAVTMGTIDLSAVDGTSSTSTRFLSKDNTWDVPSYSDNDNTTYTIGSGNTKVITLTGSDSSTSTVTFVDGSDISISSSANNEITITNDSPDSGLPAVLTDGANPGVTSLYANTTAAAVRATIGAGTGDGLVTSLTTTGTSGAATLTNGVLNIPEYTEADTLATVTARGDTTTTKSYFNGDLEVKNEITVVKTNVSTPGKITINGNTDATLQLKSEDTALAANETLGVIEFYGSDGTSPGAGVKSSIRARNGDQTGGTGNKSNLIFAVSPGNAANNTEKMRINPTGSIAFNGATNYGTSGQILKSNGDAPPTWVNADSVLGGPFLPLTGGTLSGGLTVDDTINAERIDINAASNEGGVLTIGIASTSTSDACVIDMGNTNHEMDSHILMRSKDTGTPAWQNWIFGLDYNDKHFKIGDGVVLGGNNTYLDIDPSGDLKIYEKLVVGDTSLSATKGQVDIKGISGVITTSLGQANQSHLNLRVGNALNRQGQIVWSSDVNVYTFGLGAIGMVMTAAATGTNTGTADMIFSTKSGVADAASTERMRITSSGNVGIGTGSSPSGKFHVKVGTSTPLIVASSNWCNNVGIRTTTPTASLQVKGNVSYSYVNYTNVANTWVNVISMAGYPTGLYQISIIKKTNASTYVTAIIKWDNSGSGSGTIANTITSNQLSVSFNNTTTLQAISGISTGTLMSANLQLLVTNEDSCS